MAAPNTNGRFDGGTDEVKKDEQVCFDSINDDDDISIEEYIMKTAHIVKEIQQCMGKKERVKGEDDSSKHHMGEKENFRIGDVVIKQCKERKGIGGENYLECEECIISISGNVRKRDLEINEYVENKDHIVNRGAVIREEYIIKCNNNNNIEDEKSKTKDCASKEHSEEKGCFIHEQRPSKKEARLHEKNPAEKDQCPRDYTAKKEDCHIRDNSMIEECSMKMEYVPKIECCHNETYTAKEDDCQINKCPVNKHCYVYIDCTPEEDRCTNRAFPSPSKESSCGNSECPAKKSDCINCEYPSQKNDCCSECAPQREYCQIPANETLAAKKDECLNSDRSMNKASSLNRECDFVQEEYIAKTGHKPKCKDFVYEEDLIMIENLLKEQQSMAEKKKKDITNGEALKIDCPEKKKTEKQCPKVKCESVCKLKPIPKKSTQSKCSNKENIKAETGTLEKKKEECTIENNSAKLNICKKEIKCGPKKEYPLNEEDSLSEEYCAKIGHVANRKESELCNDEVYEEEFIAIENLTNKQCVTEKKCSEKKECVTEKVVSMKGYCVEEKDAPYCQETTCESVCKSEDIQVSTADCLNLEDKETQACKQEKSEHINFYVKNLIVILDKCEEKGIQTIIKKFGNHICESGKDYTTNCELHEQFEKCENIGMMDEGCENRKKKNGDCKFEDACGNAGSYNNEPTRPKCTAHIETTIHETECCRDEAPNNDNCPTQRCKDACADSDNYPTECSKEGCHEKENYKIEYCVDECNEIIAYPTEACEYPCFKQEETDCYKNEGEGYKILDYETEDYLGMTEIVDECETAYNLEIEYEIEDYHIGCNNNDPYELEDYTSKKYEIYSENELKKDDN